VSIIVVSYSRSRS